MEAVIVIRESPEPETQEERDKVHDSVVSDAEKLSLSSVPCISEYSHFSCFIS